MSKREHISYDQDGEDTSTYTPRTNRKKKGSGVHGRAMKGVFAHIGKTFSPADKSKRRHGENVFAGRLSALEKKKK